MNDWEELKSFKCTRCGKLYTDSPPERCICRSPYEEGLIIGPFLISGPKINGDIPVICLLCDTTKTIHYTAIRRQKSCGCKPRHIDITDITRENVRYHCRKCGQSTIQEVPILYYCCEESKDE